MPRFAYNQKLWLSAWPLLFKLKYCFASILIWVRTLSDYSEFIPVILALGYNSCNEFNYWFFG